VRQSDPSQLRVAPPQLQRHSHLTLPPWNAPALKLGSVERRRTNEQGTVRGRADHQGAGGAEERRSGGAEDHQAGIPVVELCRKHGISDAMFYTWPTSAGASTSLLTSWPTDGASGCSSLSMTLPAGGLALVVDTSISGRRVAHELDDIIATLRKPLMIVSDNGTELTSTAILPWQQKRGVGWHYVAARKASPERLCRKPQRPLPGRVPQRTRLPGLANGARII
jgi:hypothetical protein